MVIVLDTIAISSNLISRQLSEKKFSGLHVDQSPEASILQTDLQLSRFLM